MLAKDKTIAPDALISLISEEYEHQKNQRNPMVGRGRKLAKGCRRKGRNNEGCSLEPWRDGPS